MSGDVEQLIATFEAALQGRPDAALGLTGLAELVADRGHKRRAAQIARRALALAPDDAQVRARCRALLQGAIPGYHAPMMNDARRNAAWDDALRRAIRPGMQVLEIGTGAGMLALMAARAGAARVITCEHDLLVADLARELAARNGYGDVIQVIAKRSDALVMGEDLERPADLLFCDIFADDLFNFDPLAAIADARRRLLAPGAPVVPAAVSLHAALAHWDDYARWATLDGAAGFDLSPMRDMVPAAKSIPIGDPGLTLLSPSVPLFLFDLAQAHPGAAQVEAICTASFNGEANGIARWIRLDLDTQTSLEARPEPGARFFSSPMFCPFAALMTVRSGERVRIAAQYAGKRVTTWKV
jgi:type II protein arginine methyltransferase